MQIHTCTFLTAATLYDIAINTLPVSCNRSNTSLLVLGLMFLFIVQYMVKQGITVTWRALIEALYCFQRHRHIRPAFWGQLHSSFSPFDISRDWSWGGRTSSPRRWARRSRGMSWAFCTCPRFSFANSFSSDNPILWPWFFRDRMWQLRALTELCCKFYRCIAKRWWLICNKKIQWLEFDNCSRCINLVIVTVKWSQHLIAMRIRFQ